MNYRISNKVQLNQIMKIVHYQCMVKFGYRLKPGIHSLLILLHFARSLASLEVSSGGKNCKQAIEQSRSIACPNRISFVIIEAVVMIFTLAY